MYKTTKFQNIRYQSEFSDLNHEDDLDDYKYININDELIIYNLDEKYNRVLIGDVLSDMKIFISDEYNSDYDYIYVSENAIIFRILDIFSFNIEVYRKIYQVYTLIDVMKVSAQIMKLLFGCPPNKTFCIYKMSELSDHFSINYQFNYTKCVASETDMLETNLESIKKNLAEKLQKYISHEFKKSFNRNIYGDLVWSYKNIYIAKMEGKMDDSLFFPYIYDILYLLNIDGQHIGDFFHSLSMYDMPCVYNKDVYLRVLNIELGNLYNELNKSND